MAEKFKPGQLVIVTWDGLGGAYRNRPYKVVDVGVRDIRLLVLEAFNSPCGHYSVTDRIHFSPKHLELYYAEGSQWRSIDKRQEFSQFYGEEYTLYEIDKGGILRNNRTGCVRSIPHVPRSQDTHQIWHHITGGLKMERIYGKEDSQKLINEKPKMEALQGTISDLAPIQNSNHQEDERLASRIEQGELTFRDPTPEEKAIENQMKNQEQASLPGEMLAEEFLAHDIEALKAYAGEYVASQSLIEAASLKMKLKSRTESNIAMLRSIEEGTGVHRVKYTQAQLIAYMIVSSGVVSTIITFIVLIMNNRI